MFFCYRNTAGRQSSDGTLTAANLIDAIITHQINQTATDPPVTLSRDGHRPTFVSTLQNYKYFFVLCHSFRSAKLRN